jgi:hypothetical protein
MEIVLQLGKIAGIAGVSIGVVLILFREIIRKSIFPNLSKIHAYRLLRLIIILTWSIAIIGIGSWLYAKKLDKNKPSTNEPIYDSLMVGKADSITIGSSHNTSAPVRIVNAVQYFDSGKFPLFNFTLKNYTDSSIIINKVQLMLINFKISTIQTFPVTEELKPMAYWDLNISSKPAIYTYQAKYPIQISSKDAGTVQVRIYTGSEREEIRPQMEVKFTFKLFFLTIDNFRIESDTLVIGK